MSRLQIVKWMTVLAMCMGGSSTASAAMETYEFTGFVGSEFGSTFIPLFAPVSGSFTIDYDAAIPGQGSGTLDSPTGFWSIASNRLPAALVFSEMVTIGGTTYSTSPLSTYLNQSEVDGGNYFGAGTTLYSNATDSFGLGFSVDASVGYLSNGLPDLAHAPISAMSGSYGYTGTNGTGRLVLGINSLTPAPVPLPGTLWLVLCGLGVLGALGLRPDTHSSRRLTADLW